jgi:hypothetical protein
LIQFDPQESGGNMKKWIARAVLASVVAATGVLGVAAPAFATSHTCTLRNGFPAQNSVTCNSGFLTPTFDQDGYWLYVTITGLYGVGGSPGWKVINVNSGAVAASGAHYNYENYVWVPWGTYKLHMWGYSGKGVIHN